MLRYSVGRLLAKYKSGKLPKAFKMVPTLTNWEEILYLTEPGFLPPRFTPRPHTHAATKQNNNKKALTICTWDTSMTKYNLMAPTAIRTLFHVMVWRVPSRR